MSDFLEIDFETRSPVDIKKHGAYVYFEHPGTQVVMASFKRPDAAMGRWRMGQPCPTDVADHIRAGRPIKAHNAGFEWLGLNQLADIDPSWPRPVKAQMHCTAATGAAMALPRKLEHLAQALGLPHEKDMVGNRLMQKLSKPRKIWPADTALPPTDNLLLYTALPDGRVIEWWADPADIEREHDYCDQDVVVEAAADARMVPLSATEQELYTISETINDRGIRVDVASARCALVLIEKAKRIFDSELRAITGGAVRKCTEVAKLTAWIQAQGVPLQKLAKAELEDILEEDDLPDAVRRAVELRQEAGKASVSKLKSFLARAGADGRIRGAFLFCAAGTRRWSSVGAQVHNLPRPRKEFEEAEINLKILFEAIRRADPAWLKYLYGDVLGRPLHLISDAIRGFLWSAPGHDLIGADYANVEGCVAAWVANETWKLKAIQEIFDNPELPDMYRRLAASILNSTTEIIGKKHPMRQALGKVSELACGFGGGVGAFRSMARNQTPPVKLAPLFEHVAAAAGEAKLEKARKRYAACCKRGDPTTKTMDEKAWLAAELIKLGWREDHPNYVAAWAELEDAARDAVTSPGSVVSACGGKVRFTVQMGFLWLQLPEGGCLAYGTPRIKEQVWVRRWDVETGDWSESSEVMSKDTARELAKDGLVKIERDAKSAVTALGVNSTTKKWERYALYGGLLFENVVQAIARDILANGIRNLEKAGYPVVMHVHDEAVAEVKRGWGSIAEFVRLMLKQPDCYAGLPLAANGWKGKRFRK